MTWVIPFKIKNDIQYIFNHRKKVRAYTFVKLAELGLEPPRTPNKQLGIYIQFSGILLSTYAHDCMDLSKCK